MAKNEIIIESKLGKSEGKNEPLPSDCTSVTIEPQLSVLEFAAGREIFVTLERWRKGELDRTYNATLQTGPLGNGDAPWLMVYGPWGDCECRAVIESKAVAIDVGGKLTTDTAPLQKDKVSEHHSIAVVQVDADEISVSSGTSGNLTIAGVASGNLLICVIGTAGVPTMTTSDDKSNTWAAAATNASTVQAAIHYANVVNSGDTVVTLTAGASATYQARVFEVSGQDTGTVVGDIDTNNNSAATTHLCAPAGQIDTGQAALVVSSCRGGADFGAITPGSGYTQITSAVNRNIWQYQIFSGATSDERGSATSANSVNSRGCIAEFKEATVAGGQPFSKRFGGVKFSSTGNQGVW